VTEKSFLQLCHQQLDAAYTIPAPQLTNQVNQPTEITLLCRPGKLLLKTRRYRSWWCNHIMTMLIN